MTFEQEQSIIYELKNYVTDHFPLSEMKDEELEEQVEQLVTNRIGNQYCSIHQKVSIVQQIYSSIRGFGLLDSILLDDNITEVMVNGPDNIFIEQNGKLSKLDKKFESVLFIFQDFVINREKRWKLQKLLDIKTVKLF